MIGHQETLAEFWLCFHWSCDSEPALSSLAVVCLSASWASECFSCLVGNTGSQVEGPRSPLGHPGDTSLVRLSSLCFSSGTSVF